MENTNAKFLLDEYFRYLYCEPKCNKMICEHKSTAEIVDELEDILTISKSDVFCYMKEKGFKLENYDGSLKWAIYRSPDEF